jgi:hypothetical protein
MTNFIKELTSKLKEKGFSKNYSITKSKLKTKNTFDCRFNCKCDFILSGDNNYTTKNLLELFMIYKKCEKYTNLTANCKLVEYRYSDEEANYLLKQKDNGIQSIYVYLKK